MSDDREPNVASGSQTIGPFFHVGPGATDELGRMAPADASAPRIRLRLLVTDGAGVPVPDALIELVQAGAFGRLGTSEAGTCEFETVLPIAREGQAAHINLCFFARGLLRHLYTRVYFEDDPALEDDPILSLVPLDRRATLVARRGGDAGTWEFPIRLQGQNETVFFDV